MQISTSITEIVVPLAKNILTPLGITATGSAIDSGIQKEIHGSACVLHPLLRK